MSTIRQTIEDRIRETVPDLRQVEGAAGLESIRNGKVSPPAAFVVEAANSVAQGIEGYQSVVESFAVVLVIHNRRDPQGGDASDNCRLLRDQVAQALIGWQPSMTYDPVAYVRGSLVSLSGATLSWQEIYQTIGVRRAG
ncbi:MAG: hypothetical protein HQL73_07290 [Magnetococcales bacterium]|nr:hypothetical protein [Magnetococcales bacterium]